MAATASVTDAMVHLANWHQGANEWPPFAEAEMSHRSNTAAQTPGREQHRPGVDHVIQDVNYYPRFHYCRLGRKVGLAVDCLEHMIISG